MKTEPPLFSGPRPNWRWAWQMALRDSRGKRHLLLLFQVCVVFAVAALVAIAALRDNMRSAVETEARGLLGADLMIETRQPFADLGLTAPAWQADVASEIRLRTMVSLPGSGQSRLIRLRAMEGAFPFYGAYRTEPAGVHWDQIEAPLAIVDQGLMQAYQLNVGDSIRLGEQTFTIAAQLLDIAGESEMAGAFAPRILIPLSYLHATGLMQFGSVVNYRQYYAFSDGLTASVATDLEQWRPELESVNARIDTVERRRERLGRIMDNLFAFLNLTGLIALLLGGLGVGAAVQVYLRGKLGTVSLLRCLGCPLRTAFSIYFIQISLAGLMGALLGTVLGVLLQFNLPLLAGQWFPLDFHAQWSVSSMGMGLLTGWITTVLFAWPALLQMRHSQPLRVLRSSAPEPLRLRQTGFVIWCLGTLAAGWAFASWQMEDAWRGGLFILGVLVAAATLSSLAALLRNSLKRLTRPHWPYSWRMALSNLYRPNNRTVFLATTLGLGLLLPLLLFTARSTLLEQIQLTQLRGEPQLILFDIQPDQVEGVSQLLQQRNLTVAESMPILTMRLDKIKGRTMAELRQDPDAQVEDWVYRWEFRNSYRTDLLDNETLREGEWLRQWEGPEPYPLSLAASMADDLGVALGDTLTWDVQGVPVESYIASLRDVDWQITRQNFAVVFAPGPLDAAPAVYALTTATASAEETALLQQALLTDFPNVSVLDLTLVYETLEKILNRATFAVQFMAGFTLLTGLGILATVIYTSRYQRLSEVALLRSIGAHAGFIRQVILLEYLMLGLLSGLLAMLLTLVLGWGLAVFLFEQPYLPHWPTLWGIPVLFLGFLGMIGWFTGRQVARHSPLHSLRGSD